jgi:putative transposase
VNTDHGSQFISFAWTDRLKRVGTRISIGSKGRCIDNIFIERLWRPLKYECVYLHVCDTGSQAWRGIGLWITFKTANVLLLPMAENHPPWSNCMHSHPQSGRRVKKLIM